MARYYDSMRELVGNTPLVRLHNVGAPEDVRLFAKLELWNPAGSVKDRTGVFMVEQAEKEGLLAPGSTIVEGTAGNMGLGIAFAAIGKGYHVVFVVPEKFSQEKQTLMRALGAKIINTPRADGMLGAAAKAEQLLAEIPNSIALRQFKNQANPEAHYRTTGPEIWRDTDGHVDAFLAGVGTGGTLTGVGRYLKEQNSNIKIIAMEPASSPLLSGGKAGSHKLQGIGANFVPDVLDTKLYDEVVTVTDDEGYAGMHLLCEREGLLCGVSSGAAAIAAAKLAARSEFAGKTIVTLLPDTGERYLSVL